MINTHSTLWTELSPEQRNYLLLRCLGMAEQLVNEQVESLTTAHQEIDNLRARISSMENKVTSCHDNATYLSKRLADEIDLRRDEMNAKGMLSDILSEVARPLAASDEAWIILLDMHGPFIDVKLRARNKIEAMRLLRKCVPGLGIKAAKNICDHRQAVLAERDAAKSTEHAKPHRLDRLERGGL